MKKMKKAAVLTLSLLLLVACLFGCGSQSSAAPAATAAPAAAAPAADAAPAAEAPADGPVMAKIKSAGKLVVGTEAQYAPYEFKDLNANFVGCDMFLAQKIADALEAQRRKYMDAQHELDIFKAVLNGESKETAEARYKEYQEKLAKSMGA